MTDVVVVDWSPAASITPAPPHGEDVGAPVASEVHQPDQLQTQGLLAVLGLELRRRCQRIVVEVEAPAIVARARIASATSTSGASITVVVRVRALGVSMELLTEMHDAFIGGEKGAIAGD